jgi:hypothetical protein
MADYGIGPRMLMCLVEEEKTNKIFIRQKKSEIIVGIQIVSEVQLH